MAATIAHIPGLFGQSMRGLLTMAAIFIPLEIAFARVPTPLFRRSIWSDLGFYFLNGIVPVLMLTALLGVVVQLISPLYASGIFSWMAHVPIPIKFVAAIVIGDIGAYWGHRWSHELPFLWHFHKVHHQAEHIDWLVTSRAHPIDMVFLKLCGIVAIYVCGLGQGSIGQGTALMSVYIIVGGIWAFFVHANIAWRFGFIEKYLATPAFHHWHHANESRESIDKNYAAIFPFVDRFFGTYFLPANRWPTSCGLRLPPDQNTYADEADKIDLRLGNQQIENP